MADPVVPASSEGGNTIPPQKKQISPAKSWVFTWNNYDMNEVVPKFQEIMKLCTIFSAQEEVGAFCETPHIQGELEFIDKRRPMGLLPKSVHWEKKRSKDWDYCQKSETRKPGGREWRQGLPHKPRPIEKITIEDLRGWQLDYANTFTEPASKFDRTVHWVWSEQGGVGKSTLCRFYLDQQILSLCVGGSAHDIMHGVAKFIETFSEGPQLVCIDIPRSSLDHVSYAAIEQLKNGFFFSGKYESAQCRFNVPHVICFANVPPGDGKLSSDRWVIREIK